MPTFQILPYTHDKANQWNSFVAQSKNGTFLANRNYMEYHAHKFHDNSLIFYHHGQPYALLPASINGQTLISHPGLTYAGLILQDHATAATTCELLHDLNTYLQQQGILHVIYKPSPYIYHTIPAEEDLYAINEVCHAQLTTRRIASVIPKSPRLPFTQSRRSGLRKAQQHQLTFQKSQDYHKFWQILTNNLKQTHNATPVHTLDEIQKLAEHFPENIHLYTVSHQQEMLAGTIIYQTKQVAHTQYISATPEGKQLGATDLLFHNLINNIYTNIPYIDFGTSNNPDNGELHKSLIFQKEGFGARAVCYDTYQWEIEKSKKVKK